MSGVSPGAGGEWLTPRLLSACSVGILLSYCIVAVVMFRNGWWFVDGRGRPVATDFIDVWAAGRLAIEGNPAAIYDWPVHQAMEDSAVGYRFDGYYGWHYSPSFLFAALPLALLPYLPAWLTWIAVSGVFFAWSVHRIIGSPPLVPVFLAAPAAAWCAVVGQNGFLTAGLIGGALGFLETRPIVSGVFLGLLTYTPQFGLLFPVALMAGRRWAALISAVVTAVLFAGVSAVAFGTGAWVAFIRSVSTTVNGVLRTGGSAWPKIQSVYSAAHQLGAHQLGDNDALAWTAQGCWILLFTILITRSWVGTGPYCLKAALLATAAIAASPYAYIYDAVILLIAAAFLVKDFSRGRTKTDVIMLACSVMLPLFFAVIGSLTVPLACLLLVIICLRRFSEVADGPASRT